MRDTLYFCYFYYFFYYFYFYFFFLYFCYSAILLFPAPSSRREKIISDKHQRKGGKSAHKPAVHRHKKRRQNSDSYPEHHKSKQLLHYGSQQKDFLTAVYAGAVRLITKKSLLLPSQYRSPHPGLLPPQGCSPSSLRQTYLRNQEPYRESSLPYPDFLRSQAL